MVLIHAKRELHKTNYWMEDYHGSLFTKSAYFILQNGIYEIRNNLEPRLKFLTSTKLLIYRDASICRTANSDIRE